jgi:hypothetical protein
MRICRQCLANPVFGEDGAEDSDREDAVRSAKAQAMVDDMDAARRHDMQGGQSWDTNADDVVTQARRVLEEASQSCCPACKAAFGTWEGCYAIECHRCRTWYRGLGPRVGATARFWRWCLEFPPSRKHGGGGVGATARFCGWCLEFHGGRDVAHTHVHDCARAASLAPYLAQGETALFASHSFMKVRAGSVACLRSAIAWRMY